MESPHLLLEFIHLALKVTKRLKEIVEVIIETVRNMLSWKRGRRRLSEVDKGAHWSVDVLMVMVLLALRLHFRITSHGLQCLQLCSCSRCLLCSLVELMLLRVHDFDSGCLCVSIRWKMITDIWEHWHSRARTCLCSKWRLSLNFSLLRLRLSIEALELIHWE